MSQNSLENDQAQWLPQRLSKRAQYAIIIIFFSWKNNHVRYTIIFFYIFLFKPCDFNDFLFIAIIMSIVNYLYCWLRFYCVLWLPWSFISRFAIVYFSIKQKFWWRKLKRIRRVFCGFWLRNQEKWTEIESSWQLLDG